MTHVPISKMTRDELEDEIRILRAALERVEGTVTSTDILRAERNRDDLDVSALNEDRFKAYRGRLSAADRMTREEANRRGN